MAEFGGFGEILLPVFVVFGEFGAGGEVAGEFDEEEFVEVFHVGEALAAFGGQGGHVEAFVAESGDFEGGEEGVGELEDFVVFFLLVVDAHEGEAVFVVFEALAVGLAEALGEVAGERGEGEDVHLVVVEDGFEAARVAGVEEVEPDGGDFVAGHVAVALDAHDFAFDVAEAAVFESFFPEAA